jgi:hypothetical protein
LIRDFPAAGGLSSSGGDGRSVREGDLPAPTTRCPPDARRGMMPPRSSPMRRFLPLAFLLAAGFAPVPLPKPSPPSAADSGLKAMVGVWVIVDDGGENPVRPEGHAKGTRWTFGDGGSLEFSDDRKDGVGRYYRLGKSGAVKTIELTVTPKRVWDGQALFVQHGVYAIDGDRLRIYLAPRWLEKPEAFPKPGGEAQYRVLVLKRVKP